MKKKSLSILMSLCMVLMLLPLSLPVSAEEVDKPTYIGVMGANGPVNAVTAAPENFPEGLSYDAASNTLTLDNVNITERCDGRTRGGILIYDSSNLTIRLIGNNVIRTVTEGYYGIRLTDGTADQETVITGDGSLVVDGSLNAAIRTEGKLIIDSGVSLLAGFGKMSRGFLNAGGGITIGGEAYTGNATEGAVVNGKVIDKVRKTPLDLTADSVSYGTEGVFNPQTQSVTVEETGEGWGWNHQTKTLTMSGAVIYNQTPLSITGINYLSGLSFTQRYVSTDTIELTEGTANAVIMGEIVDDNSVLYVNGITGSTLTITGGGSLTSVGGVNNKNTGSRGHGIDSHVLDISGSCSVTGIGGIVKSRSEGISSTYSIDISGSAKVLGLGGRAPSSAGMYQYRGGANRIHISGDAQVEARGDSGIRSYFGDIEISGGEVKAFGQRYGIDVKDTLTVTGGSLTVTGESGIAEKSENGAVIVAPAGKSLGVYAGAEAPGSRIAVVTAPDTYTLTSVQAANKYVHIAYVPMEKSDHDVNAVYIPGGAMETLYSVDVIWGSMEFTYSPGHEGIWNPDTHQLDGIVPEGWNCEEGADAVRVVNHSNAPVDVGFAYTKTEGFDAVTGAFDNAGEKLPSAMGTAVDEAPETSVTLTLTGELPDSTAEPTKIGTVTVTIDAAE